MKFIRYMKSGKAKAEAYKKRALALPGVQGASVYAGSNAGAYCVMVYGEWGEDTMKELTKGVRKYTLK